MTGQSIKIVCALTDLEDDIGEWYGGDGDALLVQGDMGRRLVERMADVEVK